MRKIITLGIMLLFLGVTISSSTGIYLEKQSTIATFDGNTLYVGGNGTGNYTSIQDAIDDASDGDTVYVYVYDDSSPYYENVEIMYKSINLIGEDRNTTIIDGSGSGDVVSVLANWVNISGFTIQNSKIDYRHAGITIWYSNHNIITGNIISNNDNGINLWHSSGYNTISGNIISGNWNGIELWESCNHNIIADNNISNNDARGIMLLGCSNNIITGNNITNNDGSGIVLGHSSLNTITGNYINSSSSDGEGISLYKSSSNNITGNIISNNLFGMYLRDSSDYNTITDNTISNNQYEGIFLKVSSNNITGNIISNNGCGINLYKSDNNTITDNNIKNNNKYGLRLSSSRDNTITNNEITSNNENGIILYESNNIIYHNNFINNTQNVNDECNNSWDNGYPSCGNYWSDYSGIDNYWGSNQNIPGSDGVGDTPYDLPCEYAIDRYPLMEPYGTTILSLINKPSMFGISLGIQNIGNKTAFNVNWKIVIEGGFVIGRNSSGITKPLLPGEKVTIRTGIILGLGKILITIAVWADNAPLVSKPTPGFLLLFFIRINPGGRI